MKNHTKLLTIILLISMPASAAMAGQKTVSDTTIQRVPVPRRALLAGLIPGGGQLYNRSWLKFIGIVAAEIYYVDQYTRNRSLYDSYVENDPSYPLPRHRYLDKRNKYAWWVLFVYFMGMADAYVEAHMATFPEKSEPIEDTNEAQPTEGTQ
ncbi:MAG: hypothetical protein KAU50_10500 [Candidatus Marinimicrobia bacterium]|nr:hypothetical protein [Candidatus Neomarinimicrobiota bacterium]